MSVYSLRSALFSDFSKARLRKFRVALLEKAVDAHDILNEKPKSDENTRMLLIRYRFNVETIVDELLDSYSYDEFVERVYRLALRRNAASLVFWNMDCQDMTIRDAYIDLAERLIEVTDVVYQKWQANYS